MHTVTQTSLYGKDLLTLKDLSEEDINALLAEAGEPETKQNSAYIPWQNLGDDF